MSNRRRWLLAVLASAGLIAMSVGGHGAGARPVTHPVSPEQVPIVHVGDHVPLAQGRGHAPAAIVVDPAGRIAHVADFAAGRIATVALDAGERDRQVASTVKAGAGPAAIALHPSGRVAYVVNLNDDDVMRFALAPDGRSMRALGPRVAAGAAPTAIAIAPSGRFVYVVNQDSNDAVGGPVVASSAPRAVAFDGAGWHADVLDGASGVVSRFEVDARSIELRPRGQRMTRRPAREERETSGSPLKPA